MGDLHSFISFLLEGGSSYQLSMRRERVIVAGVEEGVGVGFLE